MKIHRTSTIRIALVRFDEVPLAKLINRRYLERLKARYAFNGVELTVGDAGNAQVSAGQGIFKVGEDEYPIERLDIQERKIVFKIIGSSEDADTFYDSLVAFLADIADSTDDTYLQPVVTSDESEIIVQLDFPADVLYAPAYLEFIRSEVSSRASSDVAKASVRPASLTFNVEYSVTDESLNDYRITFVRKDFTVEPRRGYPLADQMYYSKAPFDTATHIDALDKLEKLMSSPT